MKTHLIKITLLASWATLLLGCQFDSNTDDREDSATIVDSGDDVDITVDLSVVDTGASDSSVAEEPVVYCTSDDDCEDSLDCTSEHCSDDGICVRAVAEDTCLINNTCRAPGEISPHNSCLECAPEAAVLEWSVRTEGAGCDDGDACTLSTTCVEGACVGIELECEDANPCTENLCDSVDGCVFEPAFDDEVCDDGSECTENDVCYRGDCAGDAISCDDENECTDDSCDPSAGCVNDNNTESCEDGDACTDGDICVDGECEPGGETNCNDGNICTIDVCDTLAGCYHLSTENPCCIGQTSVCDDGDPCTDDLCDGDGGCDYQANTATCDDGDACTDTDVCFEETCGGEEITCADTNQCTRDECNSSVGCVFVPLSDVECTDAFECTTDEMCDDGVCVGDDSGCVCEPEFSETVAKLTSLSIGDGGHPGEALDLDGDPTTCTPSSDCSAGINNSLGLLAGIVNTELEGSVLEGSLILVTEFRDFDRNPFDLGMYTADLDPGNAECNAQEDPCDYVVSRDTIDPDTCEPLIILSATRSGDLIIGGGRGTIFPFEIPLGESVLTLVLYDVQLEGTITEVEGQLATFDGILGGAVRRTDLLAAINAVDPESLPFPPSAIIGLLNSVVEDDIATDDVEGPDAASIGLKVSGIRAHLVGTSD